MSLLSWLSPGTKPSRGALVPDSSGMSRMEPTRPAGKSGALKDSPGTANGQPANRKGERMARREMLYGVVREAMMRSGVLSASYKFKVLSLDARGRQFMVMVDLSRESGGDTAQLAEIEAMVAQSAKSRYDIIVTAVYWRLNEHVAVGLHGSRTQRGTPSRPAPLESQPAALDSVPPVQESRPAPLAPNAAPAPAGPARAGFRFDPIQPDEVVAFREALAAGVARPAPARPAAGVSNYTLLTGFEDTELPDAEVRSQSLSGTQHGELR